MLAGVNAAAPMVASISSEEIVIRKEIITDSCVACPHLRAVSAKRSKDRTVALSYMSFWLTAICGSSVVDWPTSRLCIAGPCLRMATRISTIQTHIRYGHAKCLSEFLDTTEQSDTVRPRRTTTVGGGMTQFSPAL